MINLDIMEVTEPILPVPGDRISCGNRMYLFRKQRRHTMISLGIDVKVEVFACLSCGKDVR